MHCHDNPKTFISRNCRVAGSWLTLGTTLQQVAFCPAAPLGFYTCIFRALPSRAAWLETGDTAWTLSYPQSAQGTQDLAALVQGAFALPQSLPAAMELHHHGGKENPFPTLIASLLII